MQFPGYRTFNDCLTLDAGSKNHQLQTFLLGAKHPRCQTAENQEAEEIQVEEESRRCSLAVPIVTEEGRRTARGETKR